MGVCFVSGFVVCGDQWRRYNECKECVWTQRAADQEMDFATSYPRGSKWDGATRAALFKFFTSNEDARSNVPGSFMRVELRRAASSFATTQTIDNDPAALTVVEQRQHIERWKSEPEHLFHVGSSTVARPQGACLILFLFARVSITGLLVSGGAGWCSRVYATPH